ncbi:ADP-heptose synthase [Paenibacillus kandeliae]|uniref:ADP-heptose synthase n=1 Tax=Paenibacillus kandeliae TaxID=3231269 RepID=UPI003458FE6E
MSQAFVIEAVMIAIYGQLLNPDKPVTYIVPYTTIMELYEFAESTEPLMNSPIEDREVRDRIQELIRYLEEPLNKKKIQRCLQMPWSQSSGIVFSDQVQLSVVNALDNAHYGETFDPIETELILSSLKKEAPMLTDQFEMIQRLIDAKVPVQVYDIEDFSYALEGISPV